ncbi:MAG TPA: ATP-binding protein [Gammaproteobacteria bacterium]|nr:ATP-binding protein [Gammaproteobacteria bacterium]
MRLWPQSLFGRLVTIFIAGLLTAQALAIVVSAREGAKALVTLNNTQWVQRYADIASLLDSENAAGQQRIAMAMSGVRLKLSVHPAASPLPADTLPLDDSTRELETLLHATWPGRRFDLYLEQRDPDQQHRIVDVQLRDGAWVTLDYQRPPSLSQWPYPFVLESGVLVIAIVLLSLVAVRWVTRPLSELAHAADELGRDIHRPPLPEQGPLEVRAAAAAFNTMQARLRDYIQERTRILSAVSHDLRTPITRLRLRAEMLDDEEVRGKFVRDLQDMENMARVTLDFLRGLESQEAPQSMDVMALLESVQADETETGRDVRLLGGLSGPVKARPQALRRCLDNLVGNALRYGGRAVLKVEEEPEQIRIRIHDPGPGIPEAELERVFEPYYRLESARSQAGGGTGLGLSIARNIAEMHGGTLKLRNHPEGGLEAVLTLPLA